MRALVLGRVASWARGCGRNPKKEELRIFWNAKFRTCLLLRPFSNMLGESKGDKPAAAREAFAGNRLAV
jgi:hypothetical protein